MNDYPGGYPNTSVKFSGFPFVNGNLYRTPEEFKIYLKALATTFDDIERRKQEAFDAALLR